MLRYKRRCFMVIARIAATLLLISPCAVLWSEQAGADRDALIHEGSELFTRVWTVHNGLGPSINARSCVGCHAVPAAGGSGTEDRSFVSIAPALLDPTGGHVFRRLRVANTGAITEQVRPMLAVLRKAPSLFGSGLLESVSHAEIAAGAAEPGARGRIPQGKYGWKGRLRNIEEATAAAFANELGLSSSMFPDTASGDTVRATPELSRSQISAVATFIRSLQPLGSDAPANDEHGRRLFSGLGCASCHTPSAGG